MDRSFIDKLKHAFIERLSFADVFGVDFSENLRFELRKRFEVKTSCERQGVANGKKRRVDDADYIAWVGIFKSDPFSCDQFSRPGKADFSSDFSSFISIFGSSIPPRPPEGGLNLNDFDSMEVFLEKIQKKVLNSVNDFNIEISGVDESIHAFRGRIIRNSLMELESIVLIGISESKG